MTILELLYIMESTNKQKHLYPYSVHDYQLRNECIKQGYNVQQFEKEIEQLKDKKQIIETRTINGCTFQLS